MRLLTIHSLVTMVTATLGAACTQGAGDAMRSFDQTSAPSSQYPALRFRMAPVMYFEYSMYTTSGDLDGVGGSGFGVNFHVDVAVENRAYDKQVGVTWQVDTPESVPTSSAWQTCALGYEQDLDSGMELWGGDCGVPQGTLASPPAAVHLAAYATMNGTTYWDNNGGWNYLLGPSPSTASGCSVCAGPDYASPEQAVLSSPFANIVPDGTGTYAVTGVGRVWSYPGDAAVSAVYTIDNWSTKQTVEGTIHSDGTYDWSTSLQVANSATLIFAVSYTVGGVTFWDNNGGFWSDNSGGQNYSQLIGNF